MKLPAFPALLALVGISRSKPAAAEILSPSGFRDAVATNIARRHLNLCIEKPDPFTTQLGRDEKSCDEIIISTDYFYKKYLGDPKRLANFVESLVSMASSAIESLGEEPHKIEPSRVTLVIRPAAYAEGLRKAEGGPGGIWRPFVGDLIVVLVEKLAEQSQSLGISDLTPVGLAEDTAWKLALENIQAQLGPLQRSVDPSGAEIVTASSGLAPSYLLLPDRCKPGGADFDAFVVSRETYLYADHKNSTATAMLAGHAAELLLSGEDVYSTSLVSCISGRWYASKFDGESTWRPVDEEGDPGSWLN